MMINKRSLTAPFFYTFCVQSKRLFGIISSVHFMYFGFYIFDRFQTIELYSQVKCAIGRF